MREEAFNSIKGQYYSCYSFQPLGKDKRKRKISLVQCVKGAKLYHYVHNSSASIDIKNYGTIEKAKRVEIEGSDFVLNVPSRSPKKPRYEFKMTSMPTIDSPEKYKIANDLGTTHSCDFLTYKIGYKFINDKEDSKVLNFCAHELAGNFEIADEQWNKEKNLIPMQMCWFAIPTQFTVDHYNKASNQVVVEFENEKGKVSHAPLNQGEMEIYLWSLVHKDGHDKTFFAREKIADYKF